VQRNKAIDELNEDVYQLKVAVETLKQYHQDDDDVDNDQQPQDAAPAAADNDADK